MQPRLKLVDFLVRAVTLVVNTQYSQLLQMVFILFSLLHLVYYDLQQPYLHQLVVVMFQSVAVDLLKAVLVDLLLPVHKEPNTCRCSLKSTILQMFYKKKPL